MTNSHEQLSSENITKQRKKKLLNVAYERFSLTSGVQTTEERFEQIFKKIFMYCFGKNGEDTFFKTLLPNAKIIFKNNYRAMGRHIVDILRPALNKPNKELPDFFKNAISQAELAFAKNREREHQRILEVIQDAIENHLEEYKSGVVAVVVFGSHATMTFTNQSDLDIICITKTVSQTTTKAKQKVVYRNKFAAYLGRRFSYRVEALDKGFHLGNLKQLGKLRDGYPLRGHYIVVTPYDEVRKQIQHYLP